jgi:hypothetical protein
MITPAATPENRHSVRGPFRLLAGVVYLVSLVTVLGTAYVAWRGGTQWVTPACIVWLPGMVWFTRFAFFAAVRGAGPEEEYWPFASSRVANCYFLIAILYSTSTTH